MGLNPVEVLKRAELPGDLFARKDASVTPAQYFNLWRALEESGGAEELPLMLGKAISVEAFDPSIFASLCSPNLNIALRRLSGLKRLIGPMSLSVDIGTERTVAMIHCDGHTDQSPRSLGIAELVFFTQLARLATRQHIVPVDVPLTQLPERSASYEVYFGRPIRQADVNRIVFSARDASRPFLTENDAMWLFFEPDLRRRLSDLDKSSSVRQRVKSALLEMLPSGLSAIEDTASWLAMSSIRYKDTSATSR